MQILFDSHCYTCSSIWFSVSKAVEWSCSMPQSLNITEWKMLEIVMSWWLPSYPSYPSHVHKKVDSICDCVFCINNWYPPLTFYIKGTSHGWTAYIVHFTYIEGNFEVLNDCHHITESKMQLLEVVWQCNFSF